MENFEAGRFIDSLGVLGIGMLGIFIVIGAIIGMTYLLNKVFTNKN